jgi:tungstate transport system ATP-binding protein
MTDKILAHIQFSGINKRHSKKRFGFFTDKKHSKTILDNAEIELKGGECILLTGKNGSGKSTLLRILAGILKPDSATIDTGFVSLPWKKANKLIRQQVMYLYQEPYMFDGSVRRNLEYALDGKKLGSKTAYQISQALKWANLEHRAETAAKCLSGGERQRVALAQAWLKQPSILLLDEPTANMDEESRHLTEDLLRKFKDIGTALLIASHDVNHFHHTMDKRLLLQDGQLFEISDNTDTTNHTNKAHNNISLFPSGKRKAT